MNAKLRLVSLFLLHSLISVILIFVYRFPWIITGVYTYSSVSGKYFPVGEQIEVVVTRTVFSYFNVTYGIDIWVSHLLFLSILILVNLMVLYFIGKKWRKGGKI